MAARQRNDVERQGSSESRMTYTEFMRLFPDNDACLDYLKAKFFEDGSECPGCGKPTKFFRIKSRASYSCMYCRHQVYPTAGTIFHKSTVSLHLWFYGIFLMSSTRCGIAAKQLEREIGVSYKTAHRMFKLIRTLLAQDDDDELVGAVEIDETGYGGKPRAGMRMSRIEAGKWAAESKSTVFAMVERGGRIRAIVVPDRSKDTLSTQALRHVSRHAIVYTDEWPLYTGLGRHFAGHHTIHHKSRVYARGHIHTQTVESFFGLMKNGINGVYRAVSRRHLQSYVDEYAFRYNHRHAINRHPMFWNFLDRVQRVSPSAA